MRMYWIANYRLKSVQRFNRHYWMINQVKVFFMLNPLSETQVATITLWYLVQHSLSSFYKLEKYFGTVSQAVDPKTFLNGRLLRCIKITYSVSVNFKLKLANKNLKT